MLQNLVNLYAVALATSETGIPSGHLYALVAMPLGADLETHNGAVEVLKGSKLISEEFYLLSWVGPESTREKLRALGNAALLN